MVINLVEVIIIIVEVVIIFVEVVKKVTERISVIIGRVVGRATVKDRNPGVASSVGSIGGAVVVAAAVYTLLIYIGGRGSTVGRGINAMPGRVNMVDGKGCMVGIRGNVAGRRVNMVGRRINIMPVRGSMVVANAQTLVVRVNLAVGSVWIKAIKKGSTEVLPLDILLI